MIGVFLILGAVVPVLLAFALISVKNPPWLGWFLWAISLGLMIYIWLWVTGIVPSDGAETYGALIAIWYSWAPVVSFAMKYLRK